MTKNERKKMIEVTNEILNDAFWLGFILEIKRKINDYETKELISYFLLFFSSIFCDEVIKANKGIISEKSKITKKEIHNYRTYNLKYVHNQYSNKTNKIIKEMEIDFKKYVFDIYLYLNKNNELLDINFRNWDMNKQENFELYDSLVATPYNWIEILLPNLFPQIEEILQDTINKFISRFSLLGIRKKSYSCYRIFKNTNIDDNNKLYILQKYGLVKTTLFIEELLNIDISFELGTFYLNSKKFWIKIKSIIIENFWSDYNKNKINILESIFEQNKLTIESDFYVLNRRLRDNIHYTHINVLTDKELNYLEKYQKIYLKNVLAEFDKHLYILFDKKFYNDYKIAKFFYLIGKFIMMKTSIQLYASFLENTTKRII